MSVQSVNTMNIHQPVKVEPKQVNKVKFTDKFATKVKNSADMKDTVNVPRTIFKGYLAFMVGTAAASVANIIKQPTIKKALNLSAIAMTTYGTWAFVRPYVLKDKQPVNKSV